MQIGRTKFGSSLRYLKEESFQSSPLVSIAMPNPTSTKQYWQNLLKIEVPVKVTLASKRIPVDQVLNFIPGVMIQFDKSCDQPMTVEVGDCKIAEGDVVKIGDKFGVRIGQILLREERFFPLDDSNSPLLRADAS